MIAQFLCACNGHDGPGPIMSGLDLRHAADCVLPKQRLVVASPLGRVVEDDGAEAPGVARGEEGVGIDLVFPAEDVRVGLVCC